MGGIFQDTRWNESSLVDLPPVLTALYLIHCTSYTSPPTIPRKFLGEACLMTQCEPCSCGSFWIPYDHDVAASYSRATGSVSNTLQNVGALAITEMVIDISRSHPTHRQISMKHS